MSVSSQTPPHDEKSVLEVAAELYDRATEWLHDALNPYQTGLVPRNIPARPHVFSETQFADAVGLRDRAPAALAPE